MIQAQLEDGRILEFPDGTDPAVIQSTVKKMLSGDQPAPQISSQPQEESLGKNTMDFVGELSAAANRAVLGGVDFLTLDQVNNILKLTGSDKRVPTLSDAGAAIGATQGNFMDEGLAKDVTIAAGQTIPVALGGVQVAGRNLATTRGAIEEIAGLGSAATQPVIQATKTVADTALAPVKATADVVAETLPNKAKDAAKLPLLRKSGEVAAAGFKLDDAGNVVKDKVQQQAIKAGVDKGAVAMIANANKSTKGRMSEMIDYLEEGKKNLKFKNFNPVQRVVGQAIDDRLKPIVTANKDAANQLDDVADALKGQSVNVDDAVNKFLLDLDRQGIGVDLAKGKLNFTDSNIEGENLKGAQSIINNVFRRLWNTKDPRNNAYKVHTAKRYIDEQVSWGKSGEGLSGQMEGIVKSLRRNLDGALDSTFPEYDRVNTTYKETRDVIDEVQALAGRKVDLTAGNADKALGVMSRKVLSNYNTGQAVENLFDQLDSVAKKYGNPLSDRIDDDLREIVSMEGEMRAMFPDAVKRNTFEGELGARIAQGGADFATGGKATMIRKGAEKLGKLFSKSEEDQIQALKDLLKD